MRQLHMFLLAQCVILLLALLLMPCQSKPEEQSLVVFGDSLSDTGSYSALTNGSWPNPKYYFQGQSCDGPVWPEDLGNSSFAASSRKKSLSFVINYATAGAMACATAPYITINLPKQVRAFARHKPPIKDLGTPAEDDIRNLLQVITSNDSDGRDRGVNSTQQASSQLPRGPRRSGSIVMFIGTNDFLGAILTTVIAGNVVENPFRDLPDRVVTCTMSQVREILQRTGRSSSTNAATVKTLLVASLPAPEIDTILNGLVSTKLMKAWKQAIEKYNTLLEEKLAELVESHDGGTLAVRYFDMQSTLLQLRDAAASRGVNITDSCFTYELIPPLQAIKDLNTHGVLLGPAKTAQTTMDQLADFDDLSSAGTAFELWQRITGVCKNPQDYFFLDGVHYTSWVQRDIATALGRSLGILS